MLAMARAVMLNPEVILLDEPSMGLAPILVEEVFRIIQRLKEQGVTMLLVEQFAAAALNVADYGYVLENGRSPYTDPPTSLQNDPAVRPPIWAAGRITDEPQWTSHQPCARVMPGSHVAWLTACPVY
jgi:branched-chain amino acid transport system ATP-binding protein